MILGNVNMQREAIVQIVVLSDSKQNASIKAVVDTGYTGDLILPKATIEQLGLEFKAIQGAVLGDGSRRVFRMYAGAVIWDGSIRKVEINAAETGALIGMGLIENYKLEIEGKPNGQVRIIALD